MATVTSKTAEAMQAIFDSAIDEVEVIGNDLIVTLRDGTVVNAGNVRGATGGPGPTICTSLTRPASPTDSQHIFETNTMRELVWYNSKAGWFPQWNTAWGVIAKHRLTTDDAVRTVSGNTDMVLGSVAFRTDRAYEIGFTGITVVTGSGVWTLEATVNAAVVGRFAEFDGAAPYGDTQTGIIYYVPGSSGSFAVRVMASEAVSGATLQINATATSPRILWVKDVGPAV